MLSSNGIYNQYTSTLRQTNVRDPMRTIDLQARLDILRDYIRTFTVLNNRYSYQ